MLDIVYATLAIVACAELGAIALILRAVRWRRVNRVREPSGPAPFFTALRPSERSPADVPPLVVALCEFARFEAIRRNVGYSTANAIIAQAAARIRRLIPDVEIGRTHRASIEFAFAADSPGGATRLLNAVIAAFDQTVYVEGCDFRLVPRIGFAITGAALNHDELIERVETALQNRAGAHLRIIDATDALGEEASARLGLLRDLHYAIENDALELHYQPKLRCRTGVIDAAEALLRWTHPSLGPVRPDEFIAIAEETGLIGRLTRWTLARAVEDQRRLSEAGHALTIYVNISGLLLPDPDFATEALRLVEGAAGRIGFEITETAVIERPEQAIGNLHAFAAAGIKLAIDDYGSGLSSLAYLKQLPAHELKIDKLFISGLTSSHRDPLLVRSSIDLAHALEMEVTAEGVDNPMALSLLRVMGCDLIQGFLVARPLALEALLTFLDASDYAERIAGQTIPRFDAATSAR
ncbi:EAL domain-containing protein [Sphingomonas solaris]|uniref:EAL domain-containing protein n=1 Tax=Alterirhizorhabdus solaris TaxID=2529389 RepID=A0A558RC35_9SPHN|nr:EAL domain-containing protein [Sphingomonas solaris]TVV76911.1 EAL domain-containing protein [Sphingomonas solaris]